MVLPTVFGSETTDVPRCEVAFLVNTALFGRQGGDGGFASQDQFCSGGSFHIIATYCSWSAVGSSSKCSPNAWRAWNLSTKEKWDWEALETSLGIMHSLLFGYVT